MTLSKGRKGAVSCLLLAVFLRCMYFLHLNNKPSSYIWVRPWAKAYLNGQEWKGEEAWRNLSFNDPVHGRQVLLEASRAYLQGNRTTQVGILKKLWTETEQLHEASRVAAQAGLLRVFLTLNLCPVLDTVLCDKRSLSAHLFGIHDPASISHSDSTLIHPKTTLFQTPPYVSPSEKIGLSKMPPFPLQKTYFLKDPSLNLGKGITVLPKLFNNADHLLPKMSQNGFLLQEGVSDVVLLGEFKFSFRLYMFVQVVPLYDISTRVDYNYELYLSVNGNTLASHLPYQYDKIDEGISGTLQGEALGQQVTNQFYQRGIEQCDSKNNRKAVNCCPQHPTLPQQHRSWVHTLDMLVNQYGPQVINETLLRDSIKRIIVAAVQPALTKFSPQQSKMKDVLSNSSLPERFIQGICQSLYGIDLILYHNSENEQGHAGVKLLEVQMEPNTSVQCPEDAFLYAELAAGVWQIITHGRPDNDDIFQRLKLE